MLRLITQDSSLSKNTRGNYFFCCTFLWLWRTLHCIWCSVTYVVAIQWWRPHLSDQLSLWIWTKTSQLMSRKEVTLKHEWSNDTCQSSSPPLVSIEVWLFSRVISFHMHIHKCSVTELSVQLGIHLCRSLLIRTTKVSPVDGLIVMHHRPTGTTPSHSLSAVWKAPTAFAGAAAMPSKPLLTSVSQFVCNC